MKSVKKFFLWFGLLNKRLLKKISFLLILCSIPLLVVAVNLMSKQEGGILNIVVYAEDSEDELAQEIIDSLLSGEDIINYMEAESADEAGKLVQSGRADAAWIFPEGFQDEVDNYLRKGYLEEGIIQVVEKEDNVMLHLSREVLFGKLYSSLSYLVYERFVTEDLLAEEDISEEQLRSRFSPTDSEESLFVFSYLDGEVADTELSYMLYPIRGLLALVIVLCGMAMGLYFLQDEERGIFTWMPLNRTTWGSWLYLLPGLLDVGFAVLLGLTFSGVFISIPTELGLMGLYLLMVTGFSDVVRRLAGKPVRLGALIPLLSLVMLAVCPIFMGAPNIKWIQLLLPPFYYLNALHKVNYQWGMVVYIVVIYLLDFILLKIEQRRKLRA